MQPLATMLRPHPDCRDMVKSSLRAATLIKKPTPGRPEAGSHEDCKGGGAACSHSTKLYAPSSPQAAVAYMQLSQFNDISVKLDTDRLVLPST
jgi:hypothetical protein